MAILTTTAKQVERVESTKEALKACWLTLHLLLQSLLPLLLLLALQLLIHWKLLAAYWTGVVLQQKAFISKPDRGCMHDSVAGYWNSPPVWKNFTRSWAVQVLYVTKTTNRTLDNICDMYCAIGAQHVTCNYLEYMRPGQEGLRLSAKL